MREGGREGGTEGGSRSIITITAIQLSIHYKREANANGGCCYNDGKLCMDLCMLHS